MRTGFSTGTVLRYTLLPGIWPRAKELFGSGFPHLAYLIANLFEMMRLLPTGHAYLSRVNFGRFSILDVMRTAATALEPGWKNADKFIAFFAVLAGVIMLMIQCVLMLAALIITPASAQDMPKTYGGFFRTPHPEDDIAFRMLDMVFGIPGLFGAESGGGQPFHLALQAMLEFYSYGILFVGIFILLYIVVVLVAETAQSGTPFGKRFNHAWAPMRLVLFFGLLIPITHGINGSQYIILLSAKAGSGVATNAWQTFHDTIQDTYLGERKTLVATPRPPDTASIPAFVMLAKTCQIIYKNRGRDVDAWVLVNGKAEKFGSSTFQDITAKTKDNVKVRFGEKDDGYKDQEGTVTPLCGEMFFYTSDLSEPGSAVIQSGYFDMVKIMWLGGSSSGPRGSGRMAAIQGIGNDLKTFSQSFVDTYMDDKPGAMMPQSSYRGIWVKQLDEFMTGKGAATGVQNGNKQGGGLIGEAVAAQVKDGKFDADPEILKKGWAGAAIWYNQIAQQNGALITAIRNIPSPSLFPDVMIQVTKKKGAQEFFASDDNRYSLSLKDKGVVKLENLDDTQIATVLNEVYRFWQTKNIRNDAASIRRMPTENIIVDSINLLFGTSGLFDMCKNKDVHPLGQLSGIGKGLIESAIRGFATSAIIGAGSGFLGLLSPFLGQAGFTASSFMMTIAGIGLMVGFILFYVVPFLPFLYFFFAAGGWLKGIFEAVIGAPLWALGHLRIDGDGMVGEAARDGYFMALEVFLRPVLIVFGLLASLIVFSALVKVLNDIFYLVIANLPAGSDGASFCFTDTSEEYQALRGPIDEFFYTIVYAIVVYLIGISSFKLIESIPRNVMRWMGEDVAAFGDQEADAAEGLIQRIAISGAGIGDKLEGGLGSVGGQLKGGFDSLISTFKN